MRGVVVVTLGALALGACQDAPSAPSSSPEPTSVSADRLDLRKQSCDAGNGGITLPSGFCAVVVADQVGQARHLTVAENGDVYVAIGNADAAGGVLVLRDQNHDGRADKTRSFAAPGANGIVVTSTALYVAYTDHVERYVRTRDDVLGPTGAPQTIVSGLPVGGDHFRKNIQLDGSGGMFVNIGSASNSCQVQNRVLHSPGVDPCPELPTRAGIWRFDANRLNQTQSDGEHYAMGFRNTEALRWNAAERRLYGAPHERDMLNDNWPELFTVQQGADLPSETLSGIDRGDNNGWPYCYNDNGTKRLAPEYGGDGTIVGPRCANTDTPIASYPGHWAPNDILFYIGDQFPGKYRNGVFIAFHGGHDRAPLPNEGYNVVFQPMQNGVASGAFQIFADGFTGGGTPLPANAAHRPMGLAQGPDGSLYVSDDRGGRIWRIVRP